MSWFTKKEKEIKKEELHNFEKRPGPQGKPGVQQAMAGGKAAAERMRARRLAYRPGLVYEDLH